MSKSETMKQLAAASNAARLAEMGQQIAALRQARIESAEQLAEMLEPLARSMAALAVETSETLATIGQRSRQLGEEFQKETQAATASLEKASTMAHFAAERLAESSRRSTWGIHLGTLTTGVTSAVLVSAFWLWLAPPTISNAVDVGEIVRQLKPEIAALKPSKGK